MELPTIDGDSNNILRTVSSNSRGRTCSADVAAYYIRFKGKGIIVHPMVDGHQRPVAKIATCTRRAERHNNYIDAYTMLKEAKQLKSELRTSSLPTEEIDAKKKKISTLEGDSSKKLAKYQHKWPSDFAEALEEELVNGVNSRVRDDRGDSLALYLKHLTRLTMPWLVAS